jgi:hypothetical protein
VAFDFMLALSGADLVDEPRIKASIWIAAQIRVCNLNAMQAVVRRRGDPDAGSLLIRLDRLNGSSELLSQSRDAQGTRVWLKASGAEPMADADVEAYIQRRIERDPDIWVLEIEDRDNRYKPDAPVIT